MNLNTIQSTGIRKVRDFLCGLIDEDSNPLDTIPRLCSNSDRIFTRDEAWRLGVKIQTNRIRAQLSDAVCCQFIANTANFDPHGAFHFFIVFAVQL